MLSDSSAYHMDVWNRLALRSAARTPRVSTACETRNPINTMSPLPVYELAAEFSGGKFAIFSSSLTM